MSREIRAFNIIDLEVRAAEGEARKISGYAAVFNQLSEPLWGFREKIAPGTFKASIKQDDIRALWNHDSMYVLGRNKSGTLKLKEDDKGLRMEVEPPETQWAKDLIASIERGDVDQMSFGFETVREEWDTSDKDNPIRTLLEAKLFDVSVVTYPAYPQTSVDVRSAEDVFEAFVAESQAARAAELKRARDQAIRRRAREVEILRVEIKDHG